MSQYSITHTCGHSETVQIYGTDVHGERGRKADWLRSKPCRDCERAAANAAAAEESEAAGLPALTGSEKQVAWATTIRQGITAGMPAGNVEGLPEYLQAPYAEFAAWLTGQTSASWWIDHRVRTVDEALAAPRMPELLMTVISGHGDATSWQDLWAGWAQEHHPDAVARMQAENARRAEEKAAQETENAEQLNAIIERAAANITERDCAYDEHGNWRSTTYEGYTYFGWSADTVNNITAPNNVTVRGLHGTSRLPALKALDARIAQLTSARRRRTEDKQVKAVEQGHAVSVERTRQREKNTTVLLDTGITITATVPRKDDDWSECFEQSGNSGYYMTDLAGRRERLRAAYARIGREAQELHHAKN